jgi:CheY-like chemotaxis protein
MSLFPDDTFAHERPLVLVASADGPTRIAVARTVARLGLTALITMDGDAALAAARDYDETLIGAVLDAYLPTLSGWDVARSLHSTVADLPLVVLDRGGDRSQGQDHAHAAIFPVDDLAGLADYLSCLAEFPAVTARVA